MLALNAAQCNCARCTTMYYKIICQTIAGCSILNQMHSKIFRNVRMRRRKVCVYLLFSHIHMQLPLLLGIFRRVLDYYYEYTMHRMHVEWDGTDAHTLTRPAHPQSLYYTIKSMAFRFTRDRTQSIWCNVQTKISCNTFVKQQS